MSSGKLVQAGWVCSMFKTEWTHPPVALTNAQQATLDKEIEHISDEVDYASDLISHVVLLDGSTSGPIIAVEGYDGIPDILFLTYYETPDWEDLNDLD